MTGTEAMLRAVAQGDRRAFDALYRTEYRRVVAYAAGLLAGDQAAAEDVAAVAFVAIWQGAASWPGLGSARGWIRRIVRNKAVDWLRINGRYVPGLDADDLAGQPDGDSDPEETAIHNDTCGALARALARLSLEQREAVMLCYFEDMPLATIAEVAGCPEGTVKTRLFHARKALRSMLDEAFELAGTAH